MASDARISNSVSIAAHTRLGYREAERDGKEVKFVKAISNFRL